MEFHHEEDEFEYQDTLCYVFDGSKVLMMRKESGPKPPHLQDGAEFLNGPGGGIEDELDETPLEGAIRETEEETGITPEKVEKVGEMAYYKDGNPERFIHIYRATEHSGELDYSSEEGDPDWIQVSDLEYDKMWPSDSFWMPELIEGNSFRTEVVYIHGEFVEDYSRIEVEENLWAE